MSSKISIIVPIYNSEDYIEQCIESIVNQTYKNIEPILVNDGSTDESLAICKKWEDKDSRIVVIDKPNGGVATARNVGLKKATGELVGFVDHDDWIEPSMYETMVRDMEEQDADIVMCSSSGVYENGTKTSSYDDYSSFSIDKNELIKRMLNYEKIFCSSVWSKLYKREAIGDVVFNEDIVLGDDYYFNGMIYPKIKKFYYDDKALYNYRIREGTISRGKVNEHFFDKYKVADILLEHYVKNNYASEEDFANYRFSIAYEILYRLYEYDGSREQKKEWKKIFRNRANEFRICKKKDYFKIFMMKHFTFIYVKMTRS